MYDVYKDLIGPLHWVILVRSKLLESSWNSIIERLHAVAVPRRQLHIH